MAPAKTVVLGLTQRELTLIRVALMHSLDLIKGRQPDISEELRTLLNGKLWLAIRAFPGVKDVV